MVGGGEICEGRREGVENSHSERNRGDDWNDPVDGTVGCESDPEKTDRHEDTAGLTHDESEFRPDGTVFLDFLECEPIQTRQFIDRRGGGMVCSIPVPKWL